MFPMPSEDAIKGKVEDFLKESETIQEILSILKQNNKILMDMNSLEEVDPDGN